jgi:hypothetical protein
VGDKIGLHLIDLGGDVCGNGISKLVFTILTAVAENTPRWGRFGAKVPP